MNYHSFLKVIASINYKYLILSILFLNLNVLFAHSDMKKYWVPIGVGNDLIFIPQYKQNLSALNIVTNEVINITEHTVIIKWSLDDNATGQVEYGIDKSYGDFSIKEEAFDLSTHTIKLTNLESGTMYHYRVISANKEGSKIISEDSTFTTKGNPIPPISTDDTTPPVITLNGNSTTTLIQGQSYTEEGATATDNIDGIVKVTISGKVIASKVGTFILTYTAIDKAGNKASKTRKVIVKSSDTTPPVITWWNGEAWEKLATPRTYYINTPNLKISLGMAIAIDDKDGKVPVKMSGIDFTKPATYNVTYTAVDKAGNKAIKYWKITLLPADTKKPDIIFPKGQNITLNEGEKLELSDLGIYSMDDKAGKGHAELREIIKDGKEDDMLTFMFPEDLSLGYAKSGVYKLTYRAFDKAMNRAIEYMTIKIIDKTAPVITLKGGATITLTQGEKYIEAGAIARDTNDGIVKVTISGTVITSKVGTFTLTYTAVDKAGNKATKTRKVIVKPFNYSKPTIKVNGPFCPPERGYSAADMALLRFTYPKWNGSTYIDNGATATDKEDGTVAVKVSYGTINKSLLKAGKPVKGKQGIYVVIYTATDSGGKISKNFRYVFVDLAWWYPNMLEVDNTVRPMVYN